MKAQKNWTEFPALLLAFLLFAESLALSLSQAATNVSLLLELGSN